VTELIALFVAAVLAATILPLPSELPLALVVASRGEWLLPVAVATGGNFIGACTTYALGRGLLGERSTGDKQSHRAIALFSRYGAATLLFSWVPVIGDVFVFLAGAARMRADLFAITTLVGKAVRYVVIAWGIASV